MDEKRIKHLIEKPWVLPHNKNFPDYIYRDSEFSKYRLPEGNLVKKEHTSGGMPPPFKYQEFIRDFMGYPSPYRGILIKHGLGSGKTRSTIMATETFRKAGIPVLFFGPAALRSNFIEELLKWGDPDIRLPSDYLSMSATKKARVSTERKTRINKGYKFVSSNASNVLVQLAKLGIGFPLSSSTVNSTKAIDAAKKYSKHGTLDYPKNMVIVLEEVHNVNRSFSSVGAKQLNKVYNLLMGASDCKFIALSATPIVNNPFELCTLFNILRGNIRDGLQDHKLFPFKEDHEFNSMFIQSKENDFKIKNKRVLSQRLQGMVSYYRGVVSNRDLFPDIIDDDAEQEAVMSKLQTELMNYIKRRVELILY